MSLGRFLFGFTGRINRAKWWAFLIFTLLYFYAVEYFVVPLRIGFFAWLIVLAPLGFMTFAVGIKRLHDRDKNGILAALLYGVPIALMCYRTYVRWASIDANMALGQARTGEEVQVAQAAVQQADQAMTAHLGSLGWIIFGLQAAIFIWALVELGLLKGTVGDNRYGPDPLGGTPHE